jgi:hypothetical protein
VTSETTEQPKARLIRQDEEKEEAFQKSLKEAEAGSARWRAEKEAEERAKGADNRSSSKTLGRSGRRKRRTRRARPGLTQAGRRRNSSRSGQG